LRLDIHRLGESWMDLRRNGEGTARPASAREAGFWRIFVLNSPLYCRHPLIYTGQKKTSVLYLVKVASSIQRVG
jgi:hypothetical protein